MESYLRRETLDNISSSRPRDMRHTLLKSVSLTSLAREQKSLGPDDLASLESSIADTLPAVGISPDGTALSSPPWFAPIIPRQERVARDSNSFDDYMGKQIFQQNAIMAQQEVRLISSSAAGHQFQDSMMQISPVGAETALSHADASDIQQDLSDTSPNSDRVIEDFESSYCNEVSVAGNEPDKDSRSPIWRMPEFTFTGISCEESRDFEQPTDQVVQGAGDQYLDAANDISPPSAIPVDKDEVDDDSLSTSLATSTPSSSSEVNNPMRNFPDATTDHHARLDAADASSDGSNITSDNDKTADMLENLEAKGVLAEYLEKLGYQKSTTDVAAESRTPSSAQNDVSKITHICSEPRCGKRFNRACELK